MARSTTLSSAYVRHCPPASMYEKEGIPGALILRTAIGANRIPDGVLRVGAMAVDELGKIIA